MSVVVKRGINAKAESRKCAVRLWRLFPHVLLCLSLVAYAALGALLFQHIEGESASTTQQDYRLFLGQIVGTVQNFTGKVASNRCYHLISPNFQITFLSIFMDLSQSAEDFILIISILMLIN